MKVAPDRLGYITVKSRPRIHAAFRDGCYAVPELKSCPGWSRTSILRFQRAAHHQLCYRAKNLLLFIYAVVR